MTLEVLLPSDGKFFDAINAGSDIKSTDPTAFGKPFDLGRYKSIYAQFIWSGMSTEGDAIVKLQRSNFPDTESSWTDVGSASLTFTGASGGGFIDVDTIKACFGRFVYSHGTVTTGSITGVAHAKG